MTDLTYVPTWSGVAYVCFILGHHDTVFPRGTAEARPFTVQDDRAFGPGVFDMLGGIVQAIHGLRLLSDLSGVEVLLTADEETGSNHSRELIESLAGQTKAVLVVEGAHHGGALKTARKGCGTFEVAVHGRAAHAGLEPEAGVNALLESAYQQVAVAQLGRPKVGTTVTATVARSGTANNVVPDLAYFEIDVRVESMEEKKRVESAIRELRPVILAARLSVEGEIGRPPMREEASTELFKRAAALSPGIGRNAVGGGSDGNFTAALAIPTLDGLGAVGGGAHSAEEFIEAERMGDRASLIADLVESIRTDPPLPLSRDTEIPQGVR